MTRLTARWDRRVLLVVALLGYGASNAIMAVAGSFAIAVFARTLSGLSHAILLSIVAVIAARLTRPDRLGRSIAVLWIGTALATVVGVPLGTTFAADGGWRRVFGILAAFATVAAAVSLWTVPAMPAALDADGVATADGSRCRVPC